MYRINCRGAVLEVSPEKPAIMGILNTAPDSFSNGDSSLEKRISQVVREQPAIIDIGGESTRPGAEFVSEEEEIRRVIPVLEKIRSVLPDVLISVDTRKSAVAAAALQSGAHIINDVSALLFDPVMPAVAAEYHAGLILNHSRGTPQTMTRKEFLEYPDGVGKTVADELQKSVEIALASGVKKESLILDPGLGFAKNTEQNLSLLSDAADLKNLGFPLLSGPSRKRFIGALTGEEDPQQRDYGTCGAVIASVLAGYSILRVHNVKAAKDCLRVFFRCRENGTGCRI